MFKRAKVASMTVALGILFALGAVQNTAVPQKSAVPKPQDKLALGEAEVKRLMLLIDPNEKGKITKREWMKFMESEFDRLDKDKSGELDAKELAQSRLQVSSFAKEGK
jgi:EF hand